MRDRASLVLFIFVIILILILAQNGTLGSFVNNLGSAFSVTNGPLLPTVRPLVFSTAQPRNQVLPAPNLPTAYAPPVYNVGTPTFQVVQGQQNGNQSGGVTVEVVAPGGQCVVPNGWTAYTVQSGDTVAVIAANYNLTAEQLAAANCLTNPDLIYEGQVLAVPGG